jgi:hypothetical protein
MPRIYPKLASFFLLEYEYIVALHHKLEGACEPLHHVDPSV